MKIDRRTADLVAVGASVSANCLPCVEVNVARAVRDGVDTTEIADAIAVGKRVRQGAAAKMDEHTTQLVGDTRPVEIPAEGCGCS